MMDNNPDGISVDRLKRVKSRVVVPTDKIPDKKEVGLFDDVAFYVKEESKAPCYRLGRVMRMRNRNRSTVEFERPVSLDDVGKFPNLHILLRLYEREDASRNYKYKTHVDEDSHQEVLLKHLIAPVTLEPQDNGLMFLKENDFEILEEFLQNL